VFEGEAQRLLSVVGGDYFVAGALETKGDEREDVVVVVGHEDQRAPVSIRSHGVVSHERKIVPTPLSLETLPFSGKAASLVRGSMPVRIRK
jgi:hypothetical protein